MRLSPPLQPIKSGHRRHQSPRSCHSAHIPDFLFPGHSLCWAVLPHVLAQPRQPGSSRASAGRRHPGPLSRYTQAASRPSRARTRPPVPPHISHAPISISRRANHSERLSSPRHRSPRSVPRPCTLFLFLLLLLSLEALNSFSSQNFLSHSQGQLCSRFVVVVPLLLHHSTAGTPLIDGVEDSTGLTGTEVDLEGYAEASEGHLPQDAAASEDPLFVEVEADVWESEQVREALEKKS
ncbi:hypothetical protein DAI22_09g017701 [Oryza sativa Japonica Group]|nr:hypothetical protein DAI22_09g017701 [Oryza sativa Japonica Group]